jgi:hypothetical protein
MASPLILTYMSGPEDGRTDVIPVEDNNAGVTIGRLPECTINIANDPDASRQHARIFRHDGGWWLEDMSSANGTFIGEFAQSRRTTIPVKLVAGQIFRVGLTRFRLDMDVNPGNKCCNIISWKMPKEGEIGMTAIECDRSAVLGGNGLCKECAEEMEHKVYYEPRRRPLE